MRFALASLSAVIGLALFAPILAAGLPLMVMGWVVKRVAQLLEPPAVGWKEIYEFDPLLGWKAKGNLDCFMLEERDDMFHVVTDRNGWPGPATVAESDIIVFGDSHAWGYGTDHAKVFTQLEETVAMKAIAAPGYNMVQELLLMEQLGHQLKGKLVIWLLYIGNDLFDNLSPEMSGYRTPFVRQCNTGEGWEIVTRHLSSERWQASDASKLRRYYAILPALHSETFLARRAYAACDYLLKRGAEVCRRAGADLIAMAIPSPLALNPDAMKQACQARLFTGTIDVGLPDRELARISAQHGIKFVSLTSHLLHKHFKEADDHLTEEGHRRVAHVLVGLHDVWSREATGKR